MVVRGDRVDVVLEVEELPDGTTKVHYRGVYPAGGPYPAMKYNYRNVVQSWFAVEHDVSAFRIHGKEESGRD